MKRETADLEPSKLDETSRMLLQALADHPARPFMNLLMECREGDAFSLVAKLPSPTGDRRRDMSIWLDENQTPTLEFGAWHSHADLWADDPESGLERLLAHLERITRGEVVLAEAPTIGEGMPFCVLDVTDRDEILDELTSPTTSGQMKLLSWSGAQDAVLDDLREEPA